MEKQLLRQIPKVDDLLRCPALERLAAELPASAVTAAVRQVLDTLRADILSGTVTELPSEDALCAQIAEACRTARLPSLRGVINATTGPWPRQRMPPVAIPPWNITWPPETGASGTPMWSPCCAVSPGRRPPLW